MSGNPNELTIENSALVLIDHQPWVAFAVESIDRTLLLNNVTGLARAAKALEVPTVLTTVSGGVSKEAHEDAKARMVQAGAKPVTWMAVVCEWTPEYTSPERARVNDVVLQQGGGTSLATEYMLAQLSAGLVPAPAWATEPVPA